jgi:hypothetical protein
MLEAFGIPNSQTRLPLMDLQPIVGVITAPLKQQSPPDFSGRLCTETISHSV